MLSRVLGCNKDSRGSVWCCVSPAGGSQLLSAPLCSSLFCELRSSAGDWWVITGWFLIGCWLNRKWKLKSRGFPETLFMCVTTWDVSWHQQDVWTESNRVLLPSRVKEVLIKLVHRFCPCSEVLTRWGTVLMMTKVTRSKGELIGSNTNCYFVIVIFWSTYNSCREKLDPVLITWWCLFHH